MVPLDIHIGALASMPRTLSSSPLRHIASKQKAKNGKCGTAKKCLAMIKPCQSWVLQWYI